MSNVDSAVNQLITAITESETYKEYTTQLEKIKQQPGLKEQVDDFRKRNYMLQNAENVAFDQIERFEREFEAFSENPFVADFLTAELAFCRLMQNIDVRITEAVHFE